MVRLTRREAQSTGLVQPRVLRRTLPDVHLVAAPGNTWFGEGQGSYSWSTTSSTLALRIFAGASDGIPSTIASIARAASSVSKMATLRPSVPSADRPHVALTRPGAFLTCGAPPRSQASLPPLPFDWRRSRLLRTMHALAPPLTRRSPELQRVRRTTWRLTCGRWILAHNLTSYAAAVRCSASYATPANLVHA